MIARRCFSVLVLIAITSSLPLLAQSPPIEVGGIAEIVLVSSRSYGHPHKDALLDCEVRGPGGRVYTNAGFWDGGTTYRVRFSPDTVGRWTFRTICSDTTNAGLHNAQGYFDAVPYSGSEPIRAKGWPKVSANKRYLTYGDGDPFFYLGDTAWEITWKSTLEEVMRYTSDRRHKNFNVCQIVASSHFYLPDSGVVNRNGATEFLGRDYSMPNPEYFRYLDSVVTMMNDSGMIVAIVPIWAHVSVLYADRHIHQRMMNREKMMIFERYTAARYAANNVIWITTADEVYDTPERRDLWSDIARLLNDASGGRHLVTIHTSGWSGSFDFFGEEADWLDFHMFQPSHDAGTDYTWIGSERSYKLNPLKPSLNSESVFEDIYSGLWTRGDTTRPEPERISATYVRQAAYETTLSGALVGMTYGANGVWQWSQLWQMDFQFPRHVVDTALQYLGSFHMGVFRRLMEENRWYRLRPRQDLVVHSNPGPESHVPIASDTGIALFYLTQDHGFADLDLLEFGPYVRIEWIDPTTGVVERIAYDRLDTAHGVRRFDPADGKDWLVRVLHEEPTISVPALPERLKVISMNPNVRDGDMTFVVGVPMQASVNVVWWDELGRMVGQTSLEMGMGETNVDIVGLSPGAYFVQIVARYSDGDIDVWNGRIVSL